MVKGVSMCLGGLAEVCGVSGGVRVKGVLPG